MATDHVVQQGEHISRIAEKYGFLDHHTVWDHPRNATLKDLRENPSVLFPGDVVHIPDLQVKKELVPTTKTNTFKLKLEKLKLRVAIKDHEDTPIAGKPLQMNVDGSVKSLTTDGDGKAEREILKSAARGMLTITDFEIPLRIGDLDPVDKLSGQKARLNNLGYGAGDPQGPEGADDLRFRSAVEEFQCDNELDVTGICDDATQAALKDKHGS